MKFLMAGGGTGGHVIPALAVAEELKRRGHEPFFVGTAEGIEAKLVPAAGFRLERIRIGGLKRVGMAR
ncbi:MAG TPA: glycosyltransferase, partial [Bryobacteraceae bacterium]|nr:glycosyltransferase [Bryobacteraceae bacterium]